MTAESLLAHLRERGVELIPEGETLRYRAPKGALTPELRAAVAEQKRELLGLLAEPHPGGQVSGPSPWPDEIACIGSRRNGAYSPCVLCGAGSWARYGGMALCLACARAPQSGLALRYRGALRRCWRFMAQGERADVQEAMQAANEVNRLLDEVGEPTATRLRRQWANDWWREKKACPTCGGPVLHDPDTGEEAGA